jgi:hypothetical protein
MVSLFLPFCLLRRRSFLPRFVAMRLKNPCLLFPTMRVGVFKFFFIFPAPKVRKLF